jgi:hypothetical protein
VLKRGFLQVPAVNFHESFSPVATERSVQVVVCIYLFYMGGHDGLVGWTKAINIEAAFLKGDSMIPTYIQFPEGLEELRFIVPGESKEYCIQLLKLMYGNDNVASKFFKTYMKHLTDKVRCRLTPRKMDLCVCSIKWNEYRKTIVLVAVAWANDTVFVGMQEEIDQVKSEINKHFNYTECWMKLICLI